MAKLGYCRVSTKAQTTARQEAALNEAGVGRLFIDKSSGKTRDGRPELDALLDYAREGDVIVVAELSRLSRSLKDTLAILESLSERGIGFVALDHPSINTESSMGRFMVSILGAVNQLYREIALENTREGLAIAREAGKRPGPKHSISDDEAAEARLLIDSGRLSVAGACARYGTSRSALYRAFQRLEEAA